MKWWEMDAMILVFWMLSFKPAFSLSSFTLIKRLFSSSSFSAFRVVSSAYLRLLILLQEILIPACDSSSPAFFMMHFARKFNEQVDYNTGVSYCFPSFERVRCSISSSNCCFLTHIHVSQEAGEWSGISISLRIYHSLLWYTQSKAFP